MGFSATPICHAKAQGGLALIPASGSVDSTGSDLAVVGLIYYTAGGASLTSLTDNYGNTYRARTPVNNDNARTIIYDAKNITSGNAHVIDPTFANPTQVFGSGFFATWSGSDLTEPFDKETIPLGSTTPTNADSLCISIEGTGQGGSFTSATINTGTIIDQYSRTGDLGGAWAYFLQSGGPAAYSPTFTNTGSASMGTLMEVYKPATGGGGGTLSVSGNLQAANDQISGNISSKINLSGNIQEANSSITGNIASKINFSGNLFLANDTISGNIVEGAISILASNLQLGNDVMGGSGIVNSNPVGARKKGRILYVDDCNSRMRISSRMRNNCYNGRR